MKFGVRNADTPALAYHKPDAPSPTFQDLAFIQHVCYDLPLAEFFREIANKELECKVSGFSSEARKALLTHSWPGNVRELRQKIMGAVLQAQTGLVTKEHLELGITETTSVTGFSLRNDEEDKERILRALKQADGNRKVAAELLGIGRTTLYNKLEEYGLKYKFEQP